MPEDIDLTVLEKKVYQRYFEDGIWDLFLGMIIFSLGFAPLFSLFINIPDPWNYIFPALGVNILALLIFFFGKKYITVPRIGFVKFGPKRKAKQKKLRLFLFIVFIINIILIILPITGISSHIQIEQYILSLLIGFGAFTLPFCVVAYFLDFTRLYYYAFSIGLGFFLTELLASTFGGPFNMSLIFCGIGGIILIIGLIYFIRFLKQNPLPKDIPKQEVADG
ncbi:MAG: hypothetical protein ACFFB0_03540 [Promethearchaeota archaeon]